MPSRNLEPLLSRDEVQAIIQNSKVARHQGLRSEPEPVDLLASDRSVQQMLPALSAGFVRTAELLRKVLTATLRTKIEVNTMAPEILTGRGLARVTQNSACMLAMTTQVQGSPRGYSVLTVDANCAYSVVERLFGAASGKKPTVPQRVVTPLEKRMVHRTLEPVVDGLKHTMEPKEAFVFAVERVETALELIPGFSPDVTLLHVPFAVRIADIACTLTLAVQTQALDPLKPLLCAPLAESSQDCQEMPSLVPKIPLSVSVELGRTRVTLRQLIELEPGMVFALNRHPNEELPVYVEGVTKFYGYPVHDSGALGLEITRSLQNG